LFKLQLQKNKFYFFIGPSFGINIEGSYEYTEKATGYQDYKEKGTMKEMATRFGIKDGSGVDLPVGSGVYIPPEFSFAYGLMKVQTDVSWRIMSFYLGSAVKFDI